MKFDSINNDFHFVSLIKVLHIIMLCINHSIRMSLLVRLTAISPTDIMSRNEPLCY